MLSLLLPLLHIYFLNGEANVLWENFDANYANDFEWLCLHWHIAFYAWIYEKQSTTSYSNCELKYCALSNCTCETFLFCKLLVEIWCSMIGPIPLGVDNKSAMKLAQIMYFTIRPNISKLIGMLWDKRLKREKSWLSISPWEQPIDILTKHWRRLSLRQEKNNVVLKILME